MTDLSGKVVVVTGASRGIGEASAKALDACGAQVILTGRTTDDLERVADQLSNEPIVLPADLSLAGAGTALAESVLNVVDGVDVLVNNAGIPMRRMPEQLSEDDIDLVFAINVRSLLTLSIGLAPSMKKRGGPLSMSTPEQSSLASGALGQVTVPLLIWVLNTTHRVFFAADDASKCFEKPTEREERRLLSLTPM